MMKATILTLFAALAAAQASTKIAVLEFGNAGTVRRTQAKSDQTTLEGVVSFWTALHRSTSSKVQHAGMTVVPDLFRKPESGLVIGITGSHVDLESLPGVSAVYEVEETVGFMEVEGGRCDALLSNVPEWENVSAETLTMSAVSHAAKEGFSGVKTVVNSENIRSLDQQLSTLVAELKKLAEEKRETIVVHFIVEGEHSVSRRRLSESEDHRRLANDDQNAANDDQSVSDSKAYNGYYGYGYFNSDNVWVTPYKTMFQIQYFNVVTWTALGLFFALFYAIFLMVNMPLEPDTLLFGESAKLVGDE